MKRSPWFWVAFAIGWAVMLGAAIGALLDSHNANLPALVRHIVIFDVAHDVVVAPAAVAVGWAVGRWAPASVRGPARAAIALTALVVIFSYPLVRRLGERETNSSALPLDYSRSVVIVLAVVWIGAAAVVAGRLLVRRIRPPTGG